MKLKISHDRFFISVLFLGTLVSALTLPVNPWPRDGWFETQYWIVGSFLGQDNYTPIAAPAVFYKLMHWLALLLGLDLKGEMYAVSLAQNALVFLSSCLVYYSCQHMRLGKVAGPVAIVFAGFVLSTGLPQAFWSENLALFLFAAVLYLNIKIYKGTMDSTQRFWGIAVLSSLLIGLLVITRVTPIFLIPAVFFLLYGRTSHRRLFGYVAFASVTTALLVVLMLVSNYSRFGRVELTNSSGRHLWQGVTPIVDTALADSEEFLELKELNPEIEGSNYWDVQLPNDERQEFSGEELFGRLAREAIRNDPLSYLALGLRDFVTTIGQPPYRLGFGNEEGHYDPLNTDEPLPSIAESVLKLPKIMASIPSRLIAYAYRVGRKLYAVAIFFAATTYCAFLIQRLRVLPIQPVKERRSGWPAKYGTVAFFVLGSILAGIVNSGANDVVEFYVPISLCALVLFLQLLIIRKDSLRHVEARASNVSADGVFYTFAALLFFGSLWFSWQVEWNNNRNLLPYLPFLAVMIAIALTYWLDRAFDRLNLSNAR